MNIYNKDEKVIRGFGDEWERFDQSSLSELERRKIFESYFSIFPFEKLPNNPVGFDLGCGTGRWATLVAPLVKKLFCIDPSSAIDIARQNLSDHKNCEFYKSDVDSMPIENNSMDFGYSLGVLHHIPDTQSALVKCVRKLKKGAPFLLYLYYSFDNKPTWFQLIWKFSEFFRFFISRMPLTMRYFFSQIIALLIYLPMARFSKLVSKLGFNTQNIPLSVYKNYSFYTLRTDALDRFGTKLEQRFTKKEINDMMKNAGLTKISFSIDTPYWCAVGYKE